MTMMNLGHIWVLLACLTCVATAGRAAQEPKGHWAFDPPRPQGVPSVKDRAWPRTDIDAFVLARLEAAGLRPVSDADRTALLRRVYFDLTGLPPHPGEIEAFVNDGSPGAYEKVVDRLLASPAFGQRWGRHWLDVARYAESVGGGRTKVFDNAWRYRDYVIASFNADKPYDRFVTEQIAGDLLTRQSPEQGQAQVIATSFLQLGPKNLDEQNKEQLTMDVVDEQLDTIGQSMLALTLGCARCHDHKFDPIPTRDYYALAGIFTSTESLKHANVSEYLELPLPVDPQWQHRLDEHGAKVEAGERQLKAAQDRWAAVGKQLAALQQKLPGVLIDDDHAQLIGSWQTSKTIQPFQGTGYRYSEDANAQARFQAVLDHDGRYEVWVSQVAQTNRATNAHVAVHHAGGIAEHRINQQQTGAIGQIFVSLGVYEFAAEKPAAVVISTQGADGKVIADAVRWIPVGSASAGDDTGASFEARQWARLGVERQRTQEERDAISKVVESLKKSAPPAPPRAMTVRDAQRPADTSIRLRGVADQRGQAVPRGFLSAAWASGVPPIPPDRSGRLELARWMTAPDHPLTARVMVNRLWAHLLGEGLVRTVDNFGTRGQPPTHPELLDFMALQFIRDGWSVKSMVRRIVLSGVYQLSTEHQTAAYTADPENRLLWRAHRKRLSAEAMRDAMLAVSGRLDRALGGPTIEGKVQTEFNYHLMHDSARRSVYLPVFRNSLPGLFEVFDFAEPNLVCGRRNTSTLPTQALFMLNSPFVMERARDAAARLLDTGANDDTARLDRAYRQALGRLPTAAERNLSLRFIHAELAAGAPPLDAWAGLYQALFGCVGFRYLD